MTLRHTSPAQSSPAQAISLSPEPAPGAGATVEPPAVRKWMVRIGLPVVGIAGLLFLPLYPPITIENIEVPGGADRVVIVAGARYRAGTVQRFFQGSHYRELWTEPIKVPVLDLRGFDQGLAATHEGGGMQTRTLHFASGSGHGYVFRSVDKELSRLIHRGLGRSIIARILQDQTHSSHPAAAMVAAPLQAAVGLPAGNPRLVVLPDDSLLGEFRLRFGGLLGTFDETPAGGEGMVFDTDDLLPILDRDPGQRADSLAFLTARLLDFLMNDWDRHEDQWRWIPRRERAVTVWQPIPVDRDQAFARYDGLLLHIARLRSPKLSEFGPAYPPIAGLTKNGKLLDHRLLPWVSRPAWDSVAASVAGRLTDSVIDAAVARMPEPYHRISGADIADALKRRRDGISEIALAFYRELEPSRAKSDDAP